MSDLGTAPKGGIESEAGYFRRNHWVPLPQARDLDELNAQLLAACQGLTEIIGVGSVSQIPPARHEKGIGRGPLSADWSICRPWLAARRVGLQGGTTIEQS